jgi:hypothetical protein
VLHLKAQAVVIAADEPASEMLIDWPRGDVAEAGMHVDVRDRRLHVQADPHRADRLQIGGLGSLVKVRTSGRSSRRRLSAGPADNPTAVLPWTGWDPPSSLRLRPANVGNDLTMGYRMGSGALLLSRVQSSSRTTAVFGPPREEGVKIRSLAVKTP